MSSAHQTPDHAQADAARLRAVLLDKLHESTEPRLELERIGVDYGFASRVYRCRLHDPRLPASAVLKVWDTSEAGHSELRFYRQFAPACPIRLPQSLAAAELPGDLGLLLLEDLADAKQGDCLQELEYSAAQSLTRQLASLQSAFWQDGRLGVSWLRKLGLVQKDGDWHSRRREQFLSGGQDELAQPLLAFALHSEEMLARANALLAGAAVTLLHADLHLDNILFAGPSAEPVILDWARCAAGPAALDLAELMFGIGRASDCEAILAAHVASLRAAGISAAALSGLTRQLCGAILRHGVWITLGSTPWATATARQRAIIHKSYRQQLEAMHWAESQLPGVTKV